MPCHGNSDGPRKFTCDKCGGIFEIDEFEEERCAMDVVKLMGETPPEERENAGSLCETCFHEFARWYRQNNKNRGGPLPDSDDDGTDDDDIDPFTPSFS